MDNAEHLSAVSARIGEAIIDFCKGHLDKEFHADDLRQHVASEVGPVAPGSADRVLRDLRQKGRVDYVCTSRSASLYRVDFVEENEPALN